MSLKNYSSTEANGSSIDDVVQRTGIEYDEVEEILFEFKRCRLVTTSELTPPGDLSAFWVLTTPGSGWATHIHNVTPRYQQYSPIWDESDS